MALTCSFLWYLVPGGLPLPDSPEHLVGMLGLPALRHGPTDRVGFQRARSRSLDPGLVGGGFLPLRPLDLPLLRHRERVYRVRVNNVRGDSGGVLGLNVYGAKKFPNVYGAKKFPIFSADLFRADGQAYDIWKIVNKSFKLDLAEYEKQGRIHLSTFFALTYGFGFAPIASTLTHVALFRGREIYQRYRGSSEGKEDVHTKLMKKYKDIPSWWFYVLLAASIAVSVALCISLKKEVQVPWFALLLAAAIAFIFTLPTSIITATTNQ
ncbi:hypothetical protein NMG60_11003443 [Bertholletia excelsa]